MGKIARWAGMVALAALVLVWIAGEFMLPERNPPGRHTGTILSAAADPLLRRACFDCHSHETSWPVYTRWPVVSLLLAIEIRDGREELNFSNWDGMSAQERKEKWEKSVEEIREGEMPPKVYLWMHPEANLSQAELDLLQTGVAATDPAGAGDDD